jgi:small subunit ribosomal protein S6
VLDVTCEPATVAELDRQLGLNESVLRTKVMRREAPRAAARPASGSRPGAPAVPGAPTPSPSTVPAPPASAR